jgi:4-amino-4-deoxy-L-arabinose transferase-like glycosyltransferase
MSNAVSDVAPHTAAVRGVRRQWPMAAILLVAAAMRLYGLDFGLPALLDPDELIFIGGAHQLFESGTLNPGWFGHPATTTIYVVGLVVATVLGAGLATGDFANPDAFMQALFFDPGMVVLPARLVMAAFGVACVALTARLAVRLGGGQTAALVASGLMAINPVNITWSQVIRSDIMALTFLLLAALACVNVLERDRQRDRLAACLFIALAITSKWPFAVAFVSLTGALYLRARAKEATQGFSRLALARQVAVAGSVCVLLVIAISPHLLLDYPTLLSNLQGEAKVAHLGGKLGGPVENLIYYLTQPIFGGLGLLGTALAVMGLVMARGNRAFWALVGAPSAVLVAVIVSQAVVWERWAIPFFPALSIAAGFAAERIWAGIAIRPVALRRAAALGATVLLAVPPVAAAASGAHERMADNRRLATNWARANLPPGASLMVEHFAFDLIDSDFPIVFPIGTAGCLDARGVLRGQINYKEVDSLRGGQSNLDYAAVPEDKQASCRTDFAILTEYARYAAERDKFPVGDARYRALLARGRVIARFPFIAGKVGGRPEVIVVDLRSNSR